MSDDERRTVMDETVGVGEVRCTVTEWGGDNEPLVFRVAVDEHSKPIADLLGEERVANVAVTMTDGSKRTYERLASDGDGKGIER